MAANPGGAGALPPPPPPPGPSPSRAPWWAAAAGATLVAVAVGVVLLVEGGGGSNDTSAASTSPSLPSTTSSAPTTTVAPSTTTPVTTTTVATTTTTVTTTTGTTAAGTGYDQAALDYFREIAGEAEFGEDGGALHRWTEGVRIAVHGNPAARDRRALERVIGELDALINTIEINLTESDPNVEIHFVPVEEFASIEPAYVQGNMGYVHIRWDAAGSIYSGRVLISTTGLTPRERAHLIREELTQGFGLLNDSWLYPDSIFYQGWTDTTRYAPIDRVVIEMLYRPELSAGMSIDRALQVLADLESG